MPTGDIARHRLFSQRLVGAGFKRPRDAVQWLVAVQSQDYGSAKWALGLRTPAATDPLIEEAFAAGIILRTHLMRPTWHFVDPSDIRWLLALTVPRVQAANAYMYRKLGLDAASLRRSNAALSRALHARHQMTRDELREALQNAGIATDGELRMGYLMMHAELDGLVCSGPRRGRQHTYTLLDERVPPAKDVARDEALAKLASRYFVSRGPATVNDLAKWSGLTVADARIGLESAQTNLVREVVDGKTYWLSPRKAAALAQASPTAHLLSIYDEFVSGYKDRSAIVSKRNAARLLAMGNALSHIIVVDGQVVGTWKPRVVGDGVVVAASLFERPSRSEDQAINVAASRYGAFLGMSARVEL